MHLHVQPNAKKTQIIGLHGDAIKIKVHAPPVDGKANEEILDYFSGLLKKGEGPVSLISGETSKSKRIRIANITLNRTHEILGLCS